MPNTVTGSIEISLDQTFLKATATFQPQEKGQEWNVQGVTRLLTEKGIIYGKDKDRIEKALEEFSKAENKPVSALIAEGDPLELPVPDEIEWNIQEIPEELREIAEEILSSAPDPVIEIIHYEKIKHQKTIEKKGVLPFLGSKKEVVTEIDKIEKRENVTLEGNVQQTGWVEADQSIGIFIPGKPGKPGKDLFGKPITPEDRNTSFHFSQQISRQKGNLIARQSGILRIGSNWADILPYSNHQWELSFSRDKSTCYLDFTPGHPKAPPVELDELFREIDESGLSRESILSEAELQELLDNAIADQEPLSFYSISLDTDGFFEISYDLYKVHAFLTLKKGRGNGTPLFLKDVGTAIKNSGIRNLNYTQIKEDLVNFNKSPAQQLNDYLLSEGTPPIKGEDRKVSFSVTFLDEKALEQQKEKKELAEISIPGESLRKLPLDAVQKMAIVRANQVIGTLNERKMGTPGTDVFGKVIPSLPGNDPDFALLDSITFDGERLITKTEGILDFAEIDRTLFLRIREERNCICSVKISEDRLKAFINLEEGVGAGEKLSSSRINSIIKEAGITKGINEELLKNALEKARSGRKISDLLFAEGKPARHPSQRKVHYTVSFSRKKKNRPEEPEIYMTIVEKGTTIAEIIIPEIQPEPGWDITGAEIPPQETDSLDVNMGKYVSIQDSDNSSRITAEKTGELILKNNTLTITDIFKIDGDIRSKEKSVRHDSSVIVTGSVASGCFVVAEGEVHIGDSVGGTLISANGNIAIGGGIKGEKKAVIRSKRGIRTGFSEYATLLAVDDVRISGTCFNSRIKCNGKLVMESEKSVLAGGIVHSRRGLEVTHIGSKNNIPTRIHFGQDYLVADQIEQEDKEIQHIKDKIIKLDMYIRKFEERGDQENLQKGRREKLKFMKLIEKRSLRLFTLREKYEEHYESQVIIRGTIFPGVVLESHGRALEITQKTKNTTFVFNLETGQIIRQ